MKNPLEVFFKCPKCGKTISLFALELYHKCFCGNIVFDTEKDLIKGGNK